MFTTIEYQDHSVLEERINKLEEKVKDLEQDSTDWAEGFITTNELLDYMLKDIELCHTRIDGLVQDISKVYNKILDIIPTDIEDDFDKGNSTHFEIEMRMDDPRYYEFLEDIDKLQEKYTGMTV